MTEKPREPFEILLSPGRAKRRLEELGYPRQTWGGIMRDEGPPAAQHFFKALVKIARGSRPANLWKTYQNFQPEAKDR